MLRQRPKRQFPNGPTVAAEASVGFVRIRTRILAIAFDV